MLKKQKVDRGAQTRKNYGHSRVLTVKECLEKKEAREKKEQETMNEKQRKAALRGVITFAKNVWKEFKMGQKYLNSSRKRYVSLIILSVPYVRSVAI